MFYTYAHYTPEGNLFYIGKGQGDRAYAFYKRSAYWNNIVDKYGKPKVEILSDWEQESDALEHEKFLISCFRDMSVKLCNLTDGGDGISGYRHTEKHKKKVKDFHTGKAWCKGRKMPEDQKQKISISLLGNKRSVGVVQTLAHREANSLKQLGNKRALGYTHTDLHKTKIKNLLVGNQNAKGGHKWVGTHIKTGEVITFIGSQVLNEAGFQHANVIKCINGQRKSHKGYVWHKELLENK